MACISATGASHQLPPSLTLCLHVSTCLLPVKCCPAKKSVGPVQKEYASTGAKSAGDDSSKAVDSAEQSGEHAYLCVVAQCVRKQHSGLQFGV